MSESHPVSTPMEPGQLKGEVQEDLCGVPYRSAVGSLLYLSMATRPDKIFAVNYVSQVKQIPKLHHLKGSVEHGLFYRCESSTLKAFSDFDYAGDQFTHKSTSSFVSNLNNGVISWFCGKPRSVALSIMEAEYVAGSDVAKELVWIRQLLMEISLRSTEIPILQIDNASAVKLVHNTEFHRCSKHTDVMYHFIREQIQDGIFEVAHSLGDQQVADIMTKSLFKFRFEKLRYLGVTDLQNIVQGEVLENEQLF